MNQDQSNLTFDESVAQVMRTLPPPIRNYLVQGKYSIVAGSLIAKYGLHVDQGGVLEREIMLLLMGIESPEEFTQALIEGAKLPQQTVSLLMQEVNTQIFIPLREQIRNGGGNQQPVKSTAPPAPRPLVAPNIGVPRPATPSPVRPVSMPVPKYYAPPPQSPAYSHPDNKSDPSQFVSKIAPLPPKVVMPSIPAVNNQQPTTNYESNAGQASINLIERKPEIHHELPPSPPAPRVSADIPSAPIQKTGAETPLQQALRTVLPPANLPGAMPPSDIMPPTPKTPPSPVSYSADPYREPVE